ncbi:hypothetical protein DP152_26305 [Salmonella enterica subsp. enterica serovar Typhimurium]|nr:DDE domain-containing protein [Salmonella enterica]ECI3397886.1 DDE-type integrase/transposase/recombinase [Salmonella enterica subsp. enterica serovar Typhimurium]ELQ9628083.1 DDE-type integrase/transposase/recombinase [Salmonella enterica]MBZ4900317.1 DDE-type integrase/transposase/recombinase [Salmonella enterica subsp. enterica serovar Typhimurium]TQS47463.1 hypothetical protein DSB74_25315 [Salmonella enterica subsp. enterica serovar Typhimurium]
MDKRLRWYWQKHSGLGSWYLDETFIKVNGKWTYLYRVVGSKAAYHILRKILNNVKGWQVSRLINTDKAPAYGRALVLLKREKRCPPDVEHRQIVSANDIRL